MTAPATAKTCIKCGTDCSNKPRTKDAQGRYTCKTCYDAITKAAAAKAAAPKPKAAPVPLEPEPDDAGVMAALLKDSPGTLTEMCPSCGSGMTAGAVVCTICGYNKETGKTVGAIVEKASSGKGEAVLGAAAAVGGAVAKSELTGLILGTIGGLIGGAIGAGLWAVIAMSTGKEYGILAWAIGGMVGFGTAILARAAAGPVTAGIAAAIAIASIASGKYLIISYIADSAEHQVVRSVTVDDEMATGYMARDVAKEHATKGKNYQWPEGVTAENATSEDEFPKPVWDDAKARYQAMDDNAKEQFKHQVQGKAKAEIHNVISEIKGEGFAASFTPFDIIFFLLAVITAIRLGYGLS
jgi:hypothetical protein